MSDYDDLKAIFEHIAARQETEGDRQTLRSLQSRLLCRLYHLMVGWFFLEGGRKGIVEGRSRKACC
jgi:Effector-associated domain 10